MRVLMIALLFLLSPYVSAFTPESGQYWNPNESGRGVQIELQDEFVFLTLFAYTPSGNATWFTAQGSLIGNSVFLSVLDRFENGQCLGCPWRQPSSFLGAGGNILIEWVSSTEADMTINGEVIPIERFNYALGTNRAEIMRGEWSAVQDFSAVGADFPFSGEVLVVDRLDSEGGVLFFEGCRADNSTDAACSAFALNNHYLSGTYNNSTGLYVIVIEDSPTTFITYVVDVGTYQFRGHVRVYLRGQNPSGPLYPVRGFRTASWEYVRTGVGPSAQPPTEKASGEIRGIADRFAELPQTGGLDAEAFKAATGHEFAGIEAIELRLIERLEARRNQQ